MSIRRGSLQVAAGSYIITIQKDGYTPKTQAVTVYQGRTANINVTLYKVSPDICTFVDEIGGPEHLTRAHVAFVFAMFRGYDYLANKIKADMSPMPQVIPSKFYYSEVKYILYLYMGKTTDANGLVTDGSVCRYTKGAA